MKCCNGRRFLVQNVLNCLWGEPLRWIYVRSVILLNCIYKDSSKSGSKLYTLFIHTYIRISFYSVLSDELKRGNNVSELCAYFCFAFSSIVSNSRTSENTKNTANLFLFPPCLGNMNSISRMQMLCNVFVITS